ncbi:MAG: hypothetical protein HY700_17730, partial [Gemmatimonadetes bacterium]|nr:hypothetical protein [Gemmatimonadota bacterium]
MARPVGGYLATVATLLVAAAGLARAQQPTDQTTVIDSIAVVGAKRIPPTGVITEFGVSVGRPITYRDIQRGIETLFSSSQYDDVRVVQGNVDGKEVLRIEVTERPLLTNWTVRGAERVPEGTVKGKIALVTGRPYDPSEARRSLAAIDSLYKKRGYYFAAGRLVELPQKDGTIRVVFDITEGRRVAISQIVFEGIRRFSSGDIVANMKTKPEGFWWWRKGAYNEEEIERDLRERLPAFFGEQGHPDFEVLRDTLVVNEKNGKGTLIVSVDEGPEYQVGEFEVAGNRRFSTEQLRQFFTICSRPTGLLGLGGKREGPCTFDQKQWDDATSQVRTAYYNNGYIYASVNPVLNRRTTSDGTHKADLRWQIQEGQPAIVNRVLITGNTITHEDVIRRAIIVVPGDLFRQDALIQASGSI